MTDHFNVCGDTLFLNYIYISLYLFTCLWRVLNETAPEKKVKKIKKLAKSDIRHNFVVFGNDVFSKHLFPMVSYTQNTHKIPISSNPRSTLLPSPLPIPLQPV